MLVARGACARPPTLARHLRLQLLRYSKREQLHEPHLELISGQIHVWWMRPDESARPPDCHTPQDSSELSDIADPATRRIRKLARNFLRSTLARYLTTEPSKLVFTRGKYGKPQLQIPIPGSTLSRRLQFNLSHTGSLIGCAVALDHAVGLDIERLDRSFRVSPLRLAKHNFSAGEIGYLEGLQDQKVQQQQFLRIWNLKEAFCKAQGLGIISTMRHHTFSISRAPDEKPIAASAEDTHQHQHYSSKGTGIMHGSPPGWHVTVEPECKHAHLSVFDVDPGHSAAVCLLGSDGKPGFEKDSCLPFIRHFWHHDLYQPVEMSKSGFSPGRWAAAATL